MLNNPYIPKKAEIVKITKETEIDYTFRLKTDLKPQFGQFVEVSLPKVGEAPISVSDFGDGWLELTIRKVGKLTNSLHLLQTGDALFIRGPYGQGFPQQKYKNKSLIITAGGTGLAPVRSLINYYYNNSEDVDNLTIVLGFKTPQDILFKEDIQKWQQKFNIILTVDKGDLDWQGNVGLITEYLNQVQLNNIQDTEVIVVGPPIMMKFVCREFLKLNIPEERIWVSYERKMCCGLGKCGHCRIGEKYVCVDGPVFNFREAKELRD